MPELWTECFRLLTTGYYFPVLTPKQVIDAYYLEVRCKVLEIAAILDRHDRAAAAAPEEAGGDARLARCHEALALLNAPQLSPNRAEQIALIFSDKAE